MSTRIQSLSERLLPCFLARPPASQSVLHCCTLQVRLTPSSGLICRNLQQRPNSSAKLLQQSSENYLDIAASARRSGQEDFQRGTPPVSLASCSISPFLRACIITEWSSEDHETDSTGTSILIPLLLLNFNMRLHGNSTAWYLFLATACTTRAPNQKEQWYGNGKWNTTAICTTELHSRCYFYCCSLPIFRWAADVNSRENLLLLLWLNLFAVWTTDIYHQLLLIHGWYHPYGLQIISHTKPK